MSAFGVVAPDVGAIGVEIAKPDERIGRGIYDVWADDDARWLHARTRDRDAWAAPLRRMLRHTWERRRQRGQKMSPPSISRARMRPTPRLRVPPAPQPRGVARCRFTHAVTDA